jgi:hypothetical protein
MEWEYCVLEVRILEAMHSVVIVRTMLKSGRDGIKEESLFDSASIDKKDYEKHLFIAIANLGWLGYELVTVNSDETKFYFKKLEKSN